MDHLERFLLWLTAVAALLLVTIWGATATDFAPHSNITLQGIWSLNNASGICWSDGTCQFTKATGGGGGGSGGSNVTQLITGNYYLIVNSNTTTFNITANLTAFNIYNDTTFCKNYADSQGNWSLDKSSYNTITQANQKYLQNNTCASGYLMQNGTTSGAQCVQIASLPFIANGSNANLNILNASTLNVGTTNLTCAQISGCGGGYTDAQAAAAVQNTTILRNGTDANFATLNVTTKLNAVATNLTTLQITENTNLYYTDARAAGAVQNTTILRNGTNAQFNNLTTNNLTVSQKAYIASTNLTTDQITQGTTNLYDNQSVNQTLIRSLAILNNGTLTNAQWCLWNTNKLDCTVAPVTQYTDTLAGNAAATALQNTTIARNGTAGCTPGNLLINITTNSTGVYGTCAADQSGASSGIANGSDANLATLNVTTKLNVVATNLTTLQIAENTNLYYTDARAALAVVNATILRNNSNAVFNLLNTTQFGVNALGNQTLAFFQTSVNNWSEINVQNTNTGNLSSSGVVATAAGGTLTTGYINMGCNGWNYTTATAFYPAGGFNCYLLNIGNGTLISNLFLGTLATNGSVIGGNLTLFTNSSPRILVTGAGLVGINTNIPTTTLTVNGSVNITAGTLYIGATNATTTQIAEGTNLYYTDTRAAASVQNTTILRNSTNALFTKLVVQGNINATGIINGSSLQVSGQSVSSLFVRNITFANSNASQYIIAQGDVSANCNTYRVCLNIYQNNSGNQGSLGIRVNDISTGAYKANRLSYSTLANPNTEPAWMFQAQSTGSQDFFGCVNIGRQLNSQGDLLLAGTITGSDQIVFWGGRNAASGALTNVSLGVYNTTGQASTNLTGTAEAYCFRNQ
jgi:hypothetical protein